MRRFQVEDKEYASLEYCASVMGTSVHRAAVNAIRIHEQALRGMKEHVDLLQPIPPELFPNPDTTHKEALAIERRWVQDNGLMPLRDAVDVLDCSVETLHSYMREGLLDEIFVYRGIGGTGRLWFSAQSLWEIASVRRRKKGLAESRYERILYKVHQAFIIQQARRRIALLRQEKK